MICLVREPTLSELQTMFSARSTNEQDSSPPKSGEGLNEHVDWLETNGFLSRGEAHHARALVGQTNEPTDKVLTKLGLISEEKLLELWSLRFDIPIADLEALPTERICVEWFNPRFLEHNRIVPVSEEGDRVILFVVDPANQDAIHGAAVAARKAVEIHLITDSAFNDAFYALYSESLDEEEENQADVYDVSDDAARLRDLASEEPVVRLVNDIVASAIGTRASDIHIEPGLRDYAVRVRVDGMLRPQRTLPNGTARAAVSRVKILASLDISEHRRPQDGRFSYPLRGRSIDIRVSSIPTQRGEALVLRILDTNALVLSMDKLGFELPLIQQFEQFLARPNGIVLVTGPTGSGKTTTLYSWLQYLASVERKILTVEDPVEYEIEGVSQSQIHPSIGLTFASALRSFLRHDPDVIMVGEIRDLETAQIAIQAAMTGHLVLSTLHTNDAPAAIMRLRQMGVDPHLLSSTLVGVVAQSLVRVLCPDCKVQKVDGVDTADELGAKSAVVRPGGCSSCDHTGYVGRTVIAECLALTPSHVETILIWRSGTGVSSLYSALGLTPKFDDGLRKVEQGLTTVQEIRRFAVPLSDA